MVLLSGSFIITLPVLLGFAVPALAFAHPPVEAQPSDGASPFVRRASTPKNTVSWSPCFSNANIECGVFEAPLDYVNPSIGQASLAVIRYKATTTPRLGTLWVNPGGPGNSGITIIADGRGELLHNVTGGYYDIASWDPRGVNNSLPRVDCFSDSAEEAEFWKGTIASRLLEVKGNFTLQKDLDAFYGQMDLTDTKLVELGQRCQRLSGDTLKYVGSAAAVRDMVAMTDAFDGPGALVNYWGFSYGTVIGSYFVNMFPNRVGRVVVDGVMSPVLWSQGPSHKIMSDSLADKDRALTGFTMECARAGSACAISNGQNATQIYQWIMALLDTVYDANADGAAVSSFALRDMIGGYMYAPTQWDGLASALADMYKLVSNPANVGSNAALTSALETRSIPPCDLKNSSAHCLNARADPVSTDRSPDYVFQAVACGDVGDIDYTTRTVFDEIVQVTQEVSSVFGPHWEAPSYCHRWPARAVERFSGPWNHTLLNPILVIGNEADPVTGFHNAKWVAEELGSSAALLEQAGYGHTSTAMHSDCTIQTVATYFISGKLPGGGKVCQTNQPLFSPGAQEVARGVVDLVTNVNAVSAKAVNGAAQASGGSGNTLPAFVMLTVGALSSIALSL